MKKSNFLVYLIIIALITQAVYWRVHTAPKTAQAPKPNFAIWLPIVIAPNFTPAPPIPPVMATATPTETALPPTATPTETALPPTATPTLSIARRALPLAVGNTWVYSVVYHRDGVTATYIITDRVIMTQTYQGLFGAEIERVASLTGGTTDAVMPDYDAVSKNRVSKIYSYIISDTEIYKQGKLDLPKKSSDLDANTLIYTLPFIDKQKFNNSRSSFGDYEVTDWWHVYSYVRDNMGGTYALTVPGLGNRNFIPIAPQLILRFT